MRTVTNSGCRSRPTRAPRLSSALTGVSVKMRRICVVGCAQTVCPITSTPDGGRQPWPSRWRAVRVRTELRDWRPLRDRADSHLAQPELGKSTKAKPAATNELIEDQERTCWFRKGEINRDIAQSGRELMLFNTRPVPSIKSVC